MRKRQVLEFSQWMALFKAHLEMDFDVTVTSPMYHEMVMYRKLYDLGRSPMDAARRIMDADEFAVMIPACL